MSNTSFTAFRHVLPKIPSNQRLTAKSAVNLITQLITSLFAESKTGNKRLILVDLCLINIDRYDQCLCVRGRTG